MIEESETFEECVVLEKDAFDPDAVFLEDIVDEEMLPRLSLAVDGLTTPVDSDGGSLDMPSENTMANRIIKASTTMPVATLSPEQLEVYGWESSFWRKIKGYFGL